MTKLEKMAFEEAKKRFAKINAFVPEEQHIAEATLQIARMGAADIYIAGFRAARQMAAEQSVAWVGLEHSLTQELLNMGEEEPFTAVTGNRHDD